MSANTSVTFNRCSRSSSWLPSFDARAVPTWRYTTNCNDWASGVRTEKRMWLRIWLIETCEEINLYDRHQFPQHWAALVSFLLSGNTFLFPKANPFHGGAYLHCGRRSIWLKLQNLFFKQRNLSKKKTNCQQHRNKEDWRKTEEKELLKTVKVFLSRLSAWHPWSKNVLVELVNFYTVVEHLQI